eukprot:2711132-Pleurochrysis_carterae.AAC.1
MELIHNGNLHRTTEATRCNEVRAHARAAQHKAMAHARACAGPGARARLVARLSELRACRGAFVPRALSPRVSWRAKLLSFG